MALGTAANGGAGQRPALTKVISTRMKADARGCAQISGAPHRPPCVSRMLGTVVAWVPVEHQAFLEYRVR
jgi:hypothetical protein